MTKWKCQISFIEPVVGNTPKDPEQLIYAIKKRAEERKLKLENEEVRELAEKELEELYPTEEPIMLTFHNDEKGLYLKDFHIIGMIKEKARQYGLTRERGLVGAIESLKIRPYRIHFLRNGKPIKKPDGQTAKPIMVRFAPRNVVATADIINPPVETEEFEIELSPLCRTLDPKRLERLLKECDRLLGLRKEYGLFQWKKLEEG